ncbi:YtxH domain-containing protein [Muricauda sp. NFXS6]|uniref:YtxH domain-containing protein n=1 Tax=Flavobacteriaceae TaxID=49546 RepID=UPI0032DF7058|tara:strand:+ start:2977 stop:3306 length:330 start_codon:yes stop_codon:yes gene_type:complete
MATRNGDIVLALLAGTIVGAGIGILFAPDKGKETREKIKRKAQDVTHDISEKASHAVDELSQSVHERRKKIEDKLEDVISNMSYKAEDIIDSLEYKLEELKKKNERLQK